MALSKGFNFMDDINFGEPLIKEQRKPDVESKPEVKAVNIKKEAIPKENTVAIKDESVKKTDKNKPASNNFIDELKVETKKRKNIQKSFLITEELNNELKNTAKELGISENELFNEILKKVFNK